MEASELSLERCATVLSGLAEYWEDQRITKAEYLRTTMFNGMRHYRREQECHDEAVEKHSALKMAEGIVLDYAALRQRAEKAEAALAEAERLRAENDALKTAAAEAALGGEARGLRFRIMQLSQAINGGEASEDVDADIAEVERLRADVPTGGVLAIHRERQAHRTREGWTDAQDDRYTNKQLAAAALNYLWHYLYGSLIRLGGMARWPWALSWFKPTSPRRCLEKAGAPIAAELDRLHRAEIKDADTNVDTY